MTGCHPESEGFAREGYERFFADAQNDTMKLRRNTMNNEKKCCEKKSSGVVPCMLAGLTSGIVIGVIGKIMLDTNKKSLMKKVNQMADAMENLGDSAKNLFQ
jgi:hypothetical protein